MVLLVAGGGPEIIAVKFVEAGAAQAEFIRRAGRRDFGVAEGGEEFADPRRTETMGELTVMFFIAARMRARPGVGESSVGPAGLKPASAPLRPASGPLGRECSPLLATRPGRRYHISDRFGPVMSWSNRSQLPSPCLLSDGPRHHEMSVTIEFEDWENSTSNDQCGRGIAQPTGTQSALTVRTWQDTIHVAESR